MATHDKHVTYTTYLRVEELLELQTPLSDGPEHDELLFITIHQVYELWFKQILHEAEALQEALEGGDTARALALMGRIRTIVKTCVSQVDVLETMTPLQFQSFRSRLASASGFQSAQFRELEAVMGRRDKAGEGAASGSGMAMAEHLTPGSPARARVEAAMSRRSLWDSALRFFSSRGHAIPESVLHRDPSTPYEPSAEVQAVLVEMYRSDDQARAVAESLTDIDEGIAEWRYRHVMMVQRTIGHKIGTGGSSGVGYLRSTLFQPAFADLWEMRSQL
jgi:tryptophan 2,3-dioxygenase